MVRILGLFKANIYTAKRYKIDWWGSLLMPLFSILPAALIVWFAGENDMLNNGLSFVDNVQDYLVYLLLGIVYWGYVEVLWSTIFMLRRYMRIGQFEDIFMSPLTGTENILGWSLLGILRTTIESLPIIVIGVVTIGLQGVSIFDVFIVILVFISSVLASFGLTFLIFGLTLLVKEGDQIASLVGNAAPFLCGLYFPVKALPSILEGLSYVFPFTWGIDIIRGCVMKTETIMSIESEIIILLVMSIFYMVAGGLSYKLLEKKARRIGVHGF